MAPDTNSPMPIDPQLTEGTARLTVQPLTVLPTRTQHDEGEADDDDGERNVGSEKRQKLNLWKCKQCREARKKCFPADRTWPTKCNRCLAHKPEPLECSEPELNTRKRGPNIKDKPRDMEKQKNKDKSPNPPKRSTTASTSEHKDVESSREGTIEDGDDAATDDTETYERPQRTEVVPLSKGVKREHPDSVAQTLKPPTKDKDENWRPAACYHPLAERQFRILKLAPGSKNDDFVSCSLDIASVDQPMRYEAISYLWGAAGQRSEKIHLTDSHGKSYPIWIRSHLYEALKFLRHPKNTRAFWVDALCINHGSNDKAEKNKQMEMKRYVFRNSENLCFWLGEDDDSKTALKFIPQILDLGGIDKLVRDEAAIENWVAFVALLKNSVFSRLLLVQEVAIAPNVTLHSGPVSIHYQDLVDAVAIFKKFRKEICLLFRKMGRNCKDLSDRKIRVAERFIEVSTNALRITTTQENSMQDKQQTQRLRSLEELVSYLSELDSTAPLDRIYSVLYLAKDGPKLYEKTLMPLPKEEQDPDALAIDYSANVVAVYQSFVLLAIKHSFSLDIICRYWAGQNVKEDLPTWVRPKQLLQPAFDSNISERTEADSLVGLPDHNNYHASRGTIAVFGSLDPPFTLNKILQVRGFLLEKISRLAPRAPEGIILSEWITLGGCVEEETKQGTRYSSPESFWRTLVADRGPKGTVTPPWYARTFKYCLLHLTPTGDINTNRLIHECEREDEESSLVVDFLQRVQSVIWNRKFLVSETSKWIGLAPTAAEEGDMLAILHGCNVPVVLRQVTRSRWELVGECYVHGIMDGEAMEMAAANAVDDYEIQ